MGTLTVTIDTAHPDIKAAAKATGLKGQALAEHLLLTGARVARSVPNPSLSVSKPKGKPRRALPAGSTLHPMLRESAADIRAGRYSEYDNVEDAMRHVDRVMGRKA